MVGLVILACYHMEEGKVLSIIAGSQDALLPTLIGTEITQTMTLTVKIMYYYGSTTSIIALIPGTTYRTICSTKSSYGQVTCASGWVQYGESIVPIQKHRSLDHSLR